MRTRTCGFELNTTTSGVEIEIASGSPTIQSTVVRSGTYALQISGLSSGTRMYASFNASDPATNPVFCRTYFRYATLPSAENRIIALGSSSNPGTNVHSWITLSSTGTLQLYDEDGQIGSPSAALSPDTWYMIEAHADLSGGAGSDIVKARLDAVEFAGATNRSIAISLSTRSFSVGGNLNAEAQTTGEWYFDDIAVNDGTDPGGGEQMSWPGSEKLVLALPTGAGDNAADTGDWTMINEIPPDDTATSGSTMIELDTTTSIADFAMTDSSTLGINSNDTITLIAPLVRIREEASGTSNYILRVKSASGGTVAESSALDAGNTTVRTNPNNVGGPMNNNFAAYTDPTTGVAWTPTGTNSVDNMQVGVATTDGNPDIWVVWLGAYVGYIPSVEEGGRDLADARGVSSSRTLATGRALASSRSLV